MGATIMLAILVALTAIAVGVGVTGSKAYKKAQEDQSSYRQDVQDARYLRNGGFIAAGVAGFFTLVMLFMSCVTIVSPTDVGVPVSFGKVGDPLNSGVHFTAPWVNVETYPTRPVTVELSGDDTIIARTSDAGQMRVEVAVRWKVDPSRAKDLFLQVRTGDDEKISNDVVEKNLRQAVNEVYSRTANLDAINDREKMAGDIATQLEGQLERYGILVEDVNIRSVEPDEKTADVISQYARQQQATRIAEEAKRTDEIQAQRLLIQSEGQRVAAEILAGLTPAQSQLLCVQAWERQVAAALNAGQPIYTSPCGSSTGVGILAQP